MRRYLKYEKRVVNNEKAKRVATNSFKQLEVATLQRMTLFPAHQYSKLQDALVVNKEDNLNV